MASSRASSAYRVVAAGGVALNDEFVYAAPTTVGSLGLRSASAPVSAPVSGFTRMFWLASLVSRILSTVGLKSTPKKRPLSAGANAGPSATALPVIGLTR